MQRIPVMIEKPLKVFENFFQFGLIYF